MMKKNKGQSMIELIFAIVLVGLVLTGVVSLIIKSSGGQTESGLKDKAVALSKLVMEGIIADSQNDPVDFWARNGSVLINATKPEYPGYEYAVTYTVDRDGGVCNDDARVRCILVTINVWWKGGSEDVTFSRFFSR